MTYLVLTVMLFEEKVVSVIQQAELPTAVQKALLRDKPKDATFRGFEKEVIDGKTFYEVQMTVEGKGRELLYRPNGKIEEIEQETTLEAIPGPAREAILRAAKTGTIRKVDLITEGKKTFYEGELLIGGQKSQVRFDAKGRPAKD